MWDTRFYFRTLASCKTLTDYVIRCPLDKAGSENLIFYARYSKNAIIWQSSFLRMRFRASLSETAISEFTEVHARKVFGIHLKSLRQTFEKNMATFCKEYDVRKFAQKGGGGQCQKVKSCPTNIKLTKLQKAAHGCQNFLNSCQAIGG